MSAIFLNSEDPAPESPSHRKNSIIMAKVSMRLTGRGGTRTELLGPLGFGLPESSPCARNLWLDSTCPYVEI